MEAETCFGQRVIVLGGTTLEKQSQGQFPSKCLGRARGDVGLPQWLSSKESAC